MTDFSSSATVRIRPKTIETTDTSKHVVYPEVVATAAVYLVQRVFPKREVEFRYALHSLA